MSNGNAAVGMSLGDARRREEAARQRRERNQVSPEVRAQRAALLDARDAIRDRQQQETKAIQQARPDAIRAVLAHANIDELGELLRVVGQLDGRQMAEIVSDVLRQRQRTGYVAVPKLPQEAAPAPEVSSPRRSTRGA